MNIHTPISLGISLRGVGPSRIVMKKVDRQAVYDLLADIAANSAPEEQVAILKDIVVEEFCFKGITDDDNLTALAAEISESMKKNPGQKIKNIKKVRDVTGMGLAEAKAYVEALTEGHPSYGHHPPSGSWTSSELRTEHYLRNLAERLNNVAKSYGREPPF